MKPMKPKKPGFTLIETALTLLLLAIIFPTLYGMFSQTNYAAKVSIFEVMATNYATEISEQLLDLSSNPTYLVGKKLIPLLKANEEAIKQNLSAPSDIPVAVALGTASADGTRVALFVSPLDKAFSERSIRVLDTEEVTSGTLPEVTPVLITIKWRIPGESTQAEPMHSHRTMVFLRSERRAGGGS